MISSTSPVVNNNESSRARSCSGIAALSPNCWKRLEALRIDKRIDSVLHELILYFRTVNGPPPLTFDKLCSNEELQKALSMRFDGDGTLFAMHGGGSPLWRWCGFRIYSACSTKLYSATRSGGAYEVI